MSQSVELPINKYLDRYKDMIEVGLKPETGSFEIYTQTINTSSWGGRNINFTLTNTALNRLILGHKCYLNFNCTAKLSNNTDILGDSPFELRDAAGNILVESFNVSLGGSVIHTDSTAMITRHFYEHLSHPEDKRISQQYADRYITGENGAFGSAANVLLNDGIRKTAITDGKRFSIIRPLTDITFFGNNDSAIPSSLPITLDIRLNSREGRMFAGNSQIDPPSLTIETVELYVYSVGMEDALANSINERLRTGDLPAVSDMWGSRNSGVVINSTDTSIASQNETVLSTTPDIVAVAFFPNITLNPTNAHGGFHPLRTSWLNTDTMIMKVGGHPIRYYKNLGDNASSGAKAIITQELKSLNSYQECPVDLKTFQNGFTPFFPLIIRPIDDMYVLPPKPFSFSFEARNSATAGTASTAYYFYKLRHQWMLSSQVAETKIVK